MITCLNILQTFYSVNIKYHVKRRITRDDGFQFMLRAFITAEPIFSLFMTEQSEYRKNPENTGALEGKGEGRGKYISHS